MNMTTMSLSSGDPGRARRRLPVALSLALVVGLVPLSASASPAEPAADDRPAVDTSTIDVESLDMVDDGATPETQSMFAYLRGVGGSGHLLFGHQNDTTNTIIDADTAQDWSGVASDTYNSVGDFPAVHGYTPDQVEQVQDAYRKGSVIAIEDHVDNLAIGPDGSGASYGNTRDPVNSVEQVLPGGPAHENLTDYLDGVAENASRYVDDDGNLIPVIYRPWHEHNGDWFWWNTSNATEGEFQELFRFTVDYLRDVRGVSNFVYAFSPNGHFETEEEYLYGYPGDDYVDLLGVDVYWDVPQANPGWYDQLVKDLRIAVTYANKTGKVAALTETGIRWDASDGLKLDGAQYPLDWYTQMASRIAADPLARQVAYMLVWRNGSTDHFWVPFEGHEVYGDHEMLPDFEAYHDREDVVFASRVGDYTGLVPNGDATVADEPSVTIHTPELKDDVSGTTTIRVYPNAGYVPARRGGEPQLLEPTSVRVLAGRGVHEATKDPDSMFWTAEVDMDRDRDGRRPVRARAIFSAPEGQRARTFVASDTHDVFVDRPAPVVTDPYLVDDFESYDDTGDNRTDLERVWWRTGATMNSLRLRNSDGPEGEWTSRAWSNGMNTGTVLRMKYDAVRGSGTTVTRSLDGRDWSGAQTLTMWVQPDGKGYDLRLELVTGTGDDEQTFEVSVTEGGQAYGYDDDLVAPQQVEIPLEDFTSTATDAGLTAEDLEHVGAMSLGMSQQPGMPQMAGLNALEYYLFDDIMVR